MVHGFITSLHTAHPENHFSLGFYIGLIGVILYFVFILWFLFEKIRPPSLENKIYHVIWGWFDNMGVASWNVYFISYYTLPKEIDLNYPHCTDVWNVWKDKNILSLFNKTRSVRNVSLYSDHLPTIFFVHVFCTEHAHVFLFFDLASVNGVKSRYYIL